MKKITVMSSLTAFALVLSLTTISTNQTKRSIKKNGFKLSEMRMGLSKAFAAAPLTQHQEIYDAAKREVNMEVKYIVDDVNKLLSAAKISNCSNVPAVSANPFYTSDDGDLYSADVNGHGWPISTVTGVTFSKKLELKIAGVTTAVLYADCNTGAMEVRVKGRLIGEDTDIIIAYHENENTGHESILMFSDYDDGNGYVAAKMAVHYIESATSQAVTYAYAETVSGNGFRGTFTANTSGKVTDAVDGEVLTGVPKNDLQAMTGINGYTLATVAAATVSL